MYIFLINLILKYHAESIKTNAEKLEVWKDYENKEGPVQVPKLVEKANISMSYQFSYQKKKITQ